MYGLINQRLQELTSNPTNDYLQETIVNSANVESDDLVSQQNDENYLSFTYPACAASIHITLSNRTGLILTIADLFKNLTQYFVARWADKLTQQRYEQHINFLQIFEIVSQERYRAA